MGDSQDAPSAGAGKQSEMKAVCELLIARTGADLSMAPQARVPVESPGRNEVQRHVSPLARMWLRHVGAFFLVPCIRWTTCWKMHYWMLKTSARSFSSYLPRYRIIHALRHSTLYECRTLSYIGSERMCRARVRTLGSADCG